MIYVRRSSKSFYENLEINTYILEYEKIIKEMEIILKNINEEKEEISEHLLNIIKHEKNNKIKKKLFELRRKIYNTVEPYEIKDEFINLKIRNDIFNRKKLIKCTNKMEELLQINTIKIKKVINEKLGDDEFLRKVYIANSEFYSLIKKTKIKENMYVNLLKYLYKESNFCTPSNFWSGVSLFRTNNEYLLNTAYFYEKNLHFKKYKEKEKIIKMIDENCDIDDDFYFNLTLYKDGVNFVYYKNTCNENQKIKINSNDLLEEISKINKFKIFKYSEIKKIISKFTKKPNELIKILIQNDIIKIKYKFLNSNNTVIIKFDEIIKITNSDYNMRIKDTCLAENKYNKLKKIFQNNLIIYECLYESLYFYYNSNVYANILEFLKNNNDITLLDFMYKYKTKYNTKKNIYDYRKWTPGNTEIGRVRYNKFIDKIKENINGTNVIRLNVTDFDFLYCGKFNNVKTEYIGQISYKDNVFIPELVSTQPGRLFGRYKKFYGINIEELIENEISKIYNDNIVQFDVIINNFKDNIRHNIDKFQSFSLYDLTDKTKYILGNLKLKVVNDKIIITDLESNEINFYINSTLSPSSDIIYSMINTYNKDYNIDFNGHGLTRVELDMNYQPRIVIEGLLLSRERIRIDKNEIKHILKSKNSDRELFLFLIRKKIKWEYYFYSDSNYKPRYCRLVSLYDIKIIKKEIINAIKYIYFEEVYPNYQDNNEICNFNFEMWGIKDE